MTLADRTAFRNQVYRSRRAHAALPAEVLSICNAPLLCGIPVGCGQSVADLHESPDLNFDLTYATSGRPPKGRPLVNGSSATMNYLL